MPFQVIAVGEILWDLLPAGWQLGGAPANFIQHARSLGAGASLVSRVGADDLGQEAVGRLRARRVAIDLIQVDPQAPTGTVGVEIGPDQQPRFTIHEDVAWDGLAIEGAALAANAECRRRLLRQPGPADRGRGRGRAPAGGRVLPRRLANLRHQPPAALHPAGGGGGVPGTGERPQTQRPGTPRAGDDVATVRSAPSGRASSWCRRR